MTEILLIDDDKKLADLLGQYFAQFGFELASATLPSQGFSLLEKNNYDLVILDIMLPEMDGFEVCKTIRRNSNIPIIMLTARGEVMDRIVGLELGADDYLPKPFEPRELVARIHGVLKRAKSASETENNQAAELSFDTLLIDTGRRQVRLDGVASFANHSQRQHKVGIRQACKVATGRERRISNVEPSPYSRPRWRDMTPAKVPAGERGAAAGRLLRLGS